MNDKPPGYDPAPMLTKAALLYVGLLLLFVTSIIGVQIWKTGEANTESWAALTGLIGWATSQVSVIYNNRYGNTSSSEKKNETIQDLTRTASVIATTAQAVQQVATNAAASTPSAQTMRTSEVNIEADSVKVNQGEIK